MLCKSKISKKILISTSNCYYKGFLVNFLEWEPNWNEAKFKKTHIWLESKHLKTLIKIGNSIGCLKGIDSYYYKFGNIRILIEAENIQKGSIFKKLITNRSIYNLEFTMYEGDISRIIDPNLAIGFNATNITDTLSCINDKKGERPKTIDAIKTTERKEAQENKIEDPTAKLISEHQRLETERTQLTTES